MATTTNFGWETPDDTDLVKDGALSIRTLGSAIDTSLVDLKGGTTGQVLSKASNTDMDFSWVTDTGDISGVTAGTGISGGGTSGTVTITNSMATAIDAKGDLIVGTGADTFDRLAVSATNGQALVVDSSTSTGLKYGVVTGPAARVYRATSDQTTTQNVWTKVQLNAETFDTDSCFDSTTNYRFTPTVAGKYLVQVYAVYRQSTSARAIFAVYKNGSAYQRVIDGTNAYTSYTGVGGTTLVDMNGTTDYLEIYGNLTDATTREFNYSAAGADGFSASFSWVRI